MIDQLTEWVAIGCRIKLIRGHESLTVEKADGEALWCYFTGCVGDSHRLSPLEVLASQLKAHISKGWEVDPGNPYG